MAADGRPQAGVLGPSSPPGPVAPRGAARRRPVIGRGRGECRTLSGGGRLRAAPRPASLRARRVRAARGLRPPGRGAGASERAGGGRGPPRSTGVKHAYHL
ncbi:unnamed protein product [Nyctereutes procyonoides]|uniref:(raccoon dog) hypothetical protein n=1 Tax=Nyctereutes procyonoides TaxID=34880 RepID=A0A811YCA6_NYCPR|nr:unnamed protein product [Nyctereutes procyonoides]